MRSWLLPLLLLLPALLFPLLLLLSKTDATSAAKSKNVCTVVLRGWTSVLGPGPVAAATCGGASRERELQAGRAGSTAQRAVPCCAGPLSCIRRRQLIHAGSAEGSSSGRSSNITVVLPAHLLIQ